MLNKQKKNDAITEINRIDQQIKDHALQEEKTFQQNETERLQRLQQENEEVKRQRRIEEIKKQQAEIDLARIRSSEQQKTSEEQHHFQEALNKRKLRREQEKIQAALDLAEQENKKNKLKRFLIVFVLVKLQKFLKNMNYSPRYNINVNNDNNKKKKKQNNKLLID